jgi:hypothetical protein
MGSNGKCFARSDVIQTHGNPQVAETRIGWTFDGARIQAKRLGASIREVLDAWADAHAATALYEQLSRLSDAELERGGIPRGELHRPRFPARVSHSRLELM